LQVASWIGAAWTVDKRENPVAASGTKEEIMMAGRNKTATTCLGAIEDAESLPPNDVRNGERKRREMQIKGIIIYNRMKLEL
jgi:hypothetical protein